VGAGRATPHRQGSCRNHGAGKGHASELQ
jgi:hypothetical protein